MTILQNIEASYDDFDALYASSKRSDLEKIAEALYKKYCASFANKRYITNIEWIGRHYLASKKMTMSALFYTQARDLKSRKMQNISFYACYYSLFNGLSANLFLNPNIELRVARSISHSALLSKIENFFVRPGIYKGATIELLGDLRFARELYSYHLPLSGSSSRDDDGLDVGSLFSRLTETLPVVLQVSSLLSYLSYAAWEKKVGGPIDEYREHQRVVDDFFHSVVGHDDSSGSRIHYDDGDYVSLGTFINRIQQPMPIAWIIADKILDELECSWPDRDEESQDGYEIESVSRYLTETIGA